MPYYKGGYMQDYTDELMRSSGNNPWYDPMSKYPNLAGGADAIRQLVSQMIMMKQMKEQGENEQRQRGYENLMAYKKQSDEKGLAERKYQLEQKRVNALIKEKEQPEPDFQPSLKQFVEEKLGLPKGSLDKAPPAEVGKALKSYLDSVSSKTSKEPTTYDKQVAAARGALAAKQITPEQFQSVTTGLSAISPTDQAWKRQKSLVAGAIAAFNKEREVMYKQYAAMDEKRQAKYKPNIDRVEDALANLQIIDAKLVEGVSLPDEEIQKATKLLTNMRAIKDGTFDLNTYSVADYIDESSVTKTMQTATNPQTGEKVAWVNGKWVKIRKKTK